MRHTRSSGPAPSPFEFLPSPSTAAKDHHLRSLMSGGVSGRITSGHACKRQIELDDTLTWHNHTDNQPKQTTEHPDNVILNADQLSKLIEDNFTSKSFVEDNYLRAREREVSW